MGSPVRTPKLRVPPGSQLPGRGRGAPRDQKASRAERVWALDADLAAAFHRIDHDRLLETLGSFPARDLIRDWLKAGVFETGKGFAPTDEGTPQDRLISPLLLNVALHGLEKAAGVPLPGHRQQCRPVTASHPLGRHEGCSAK